LNLAWLALVAFLVVLAFGFVLLFGAPFLPTLKKQTNEALDLLNLKPGQLLLELGSGDGRVLRAATRRGIHAVGYELNPLLVLYSKVRNWPYRQLTKTHWRNFWHVSLAPADGIYVFLLRPYMAKLDKKITHEITRPTKVISFAFALPRRKPAKTQSGLMLYNYQPLKKP
jgi:SAM-dependent methyltransferase